MNENEKSIFVKLFETVPKLEREDQKYIVGIAEGMAIVKERQQDKNQLQESVTV